MRNFKPKRNSHLKGVNMTTGSSCYLSQASFCSSLRSSYQEKFIIEGKKNSTSLVSTRHQSVELPLSKDELYLNYFQDPLYAYTMRFCTQQWLATTAANSDNFFEFQSEHFIRPNSRTRIRYLAVPALTLCLSFIRSFTCDCTPTSGYWDIILCKHKDLIRAYICGFPPSHNKERFLSKKRRCARKRTCPGERSSVVGEDLIGVSSRRQPRTLMWNRLPFKPLKSRLEHSGLGSPRPGVPAVGWSLVRKLVASRNILGLTRILSLKWSCMEVGPSTPAAGARRSNQRTQVRGFVAIVVLRLRESIVETVPTLSSLHQSPLVVLQPSLGHYFAHINSEWKEEYKALFEVIKWSDIVIEWELNTVPETTESKLGVIRRLDIQALAVAGYSGCSEWQHADGYITTSPMATVAITESTAAFQVEVPAVISGILTSNYNGGGCKAFKAKPLVESNFHCGLTSSGLTRHGVVDLWCNDYGEG
ncbi:hypothetical protein VNO77_04440 [Canavalia gladiata]|uniref:Uncharacterized protein n=1 Tax=Canavalia gladiata TaxID=3824 RepID=A0AAN9R4S8_CANGL